MEKRPHTYLESRIWRPEAHVSDYCVEPTCWDTLSLGNWGTLSPLGEPPWRFVGRRCWSGDVMTGALVRLFVSD